MKKIFVLYQLEVKKIAEVYNDYYQGDQLDATVVTTLYEVFRSVSEEDVMNELERLLIVGTEYEYEYTIKTVYY